MNLQLTINSVIDTIIKYSKQPLDCTFQRNEYLAELLDVELVNCAFGGATSDLNQETNQQPDVPGLKQQVQNYISSRARYENYLSQSPLHKNESEEQLSLIKSVCKKMLKEEALNQDWEKIGEKLLESPKKSSLQKDLEIKNVRDEFINPYDGSISGDLEGEYFTPEKYFYWDLIHWSSKVHEVVAADLFEIV
ncbi:1686_t:CDS:2, partial [Racocetra fulgida]